MIHPRIRPFRLAFACLVVVLAVDRPVFAQDPGVGVVEGRVFNPSSGEYVENARVTIDGTALETLTDATGQYRLRNVPAGLAQVRVFRTGAPAETRPVTVVAGDTVEMNFSFTGFKPRGAPGDAIRLDEFVVKAATEMDGAAIAINTQRFAPNLMNVVAADEFGPVANGNAGEVLKSVPGVIISLGSQGEAYQISLGGVPPNNVPVTVGGFDLANPAGGTSRGAGLHLLSINNAARIEVSHTPTPETSGSALAGSVNIVPRSSFERSRPIYHFSAALLMRDNDRSFHKTPGPRREPTRKVSPEFMASAVVPVNKRFGFTLSASTSPVYTPQEFMQNTWRGAGAATNGTTLPDTTPDRPYLTDYAVRDRTAIAERKALGATLDYRLTPNDRLSFSFQYGFAGAEINMRTLTFFANRVAPGDFTSTSTRGATGAGEIRLVNVANTVAQNLYMPSVTYRHDGSAWDAEAGFGVSLTDRRDTDLTSGAFNNTQARRQNVTVSFNDIFYLRPRVITVTDGITGAAVDPFSLNTYSLNTANGNSLETNAVQRNAFANVKREFFAAVPFTLKAGIDVRYVMKDIRRDTPTFTFVGNDRVANSADDNASVVLDESFSQRTAPFGFPRIQWVSNEELYELYRTNPGYFTLNETTRYTQGVVTSKYAEETISSAYVRSDVNFLAGRLKLVGGLRAEQTNVEGEGQLIDVTRNYQRSANGQVILGANGRPLPIATGALAVAQLTNVERGLHSKKEYLRWFPSLNAAFNLRDNLILRGGYFWSVGRPDLVQYAGSLTLPDTQNLPGPNDFISVNNAGIKAWSARTVKVSLEHYFEPVGLLSLGAFRRDFENLFGTTRFRATPEFLGLYGLSPEVYGDYDVSTQYNLPTQAHMTGVEFNYKQALTFLPAWARGVQVFVNGTAQRMTGDDSNSFSGYVPRAANWGIMLTRPKYRLGVKWNYVGRQRLAMVAPGRSIEPGTYNWASKRLLIDVNAEYTFYRRVAVFVNLTNLHDAPVAFEVYGPRTPEYAQFRDQARFGAVWTIGIKGSF